MKIYHLIFDVDGTLTSESQENPYLLMARNLGLEKEFQDLIVSYLSGGLTYQQLVDAESNILRSGEYKTGDLYEAFPNVELRDGAGEVIEELREMGLLITLLSSGIDYVVDKIVSMLNIHPDNVYCNSFVSDERGNFERIEVRVSGEKTSAFDEIIKRNGIDIRKTAYVGDNNWDERLGKYILRRGGYLFYLGQNPEIIDPDGIYRETGKMIQISDLHDILEKIKEINPDSL